MTAMGELRRLTQAEIDAACEALIKGASEVEIGGEVVHIVLLDPAWTSEEQERWRAAQEGQVEGRVQGEYQDGNSARQEA
jgi:hypothetical protein